MGYNASKACLYRSLQTIAGLPKATMEAAIARGQGKSATGAILENVTLEVIMPSTVAMIIESETDNKARTMMDLRHLIKQHGGSVTPTNYLFQKKGRIAFEKDERNLGVDEVLDEAIEAGAEDVEADEDGTIIVWTEPNKTMSAADALQKSLNLKVESSDIIWDPAKELSAFVQALQDNPNVQGVYANAAQGSLADDVWEDLQEKLDA
jgi:transcriptional/translational regulatory protein YebC/TACO1